ncbi:MAG: glycine cleavage system protein GcvH [SAR202 cluster bacterium]|nr:glycine cleavage system protein GcvH [SAR202 cluster bacterium]|tara:strand:- start:5426 stop:5809 length:384 start_codon:yes stop_codon:yes gene_type:complete
MSQNEIRYSKEHEWVKSTEEGLVLIGVTKFAQEQMGDVVYVEIDDVGTSCDQFAKVGEIESVKAVSDLYTPIGGEIVEINQELINNPELVNNDPLNEGWMLKIKVLDIQEINNLMTEEEYNKYIQQL